MEPLLACLQVHQYLAVWLTGVGTLALAAATVFVMVLWPLIQERRRRPVLDLSIRIGPPDCHKVPVTVAKTGQFLYDTYYLRLAVSNKSGRQPAEDVEVYMAGLLRRSRLEDGSFVELMAFSAMNLRWSYEHQVRYPILTGGTYMHCDLAHIVDPKKRKSLHYEDNPSLGIGYDQTLLAFDVIFQHNLLTHLLPPGTYRVPLVISASNAGPVKRCLEITLTGSWYDDEDAMLFGRKGVSVSLVDPTDCFSLIGSA